MMKGGREGHTVQTNHENHYGPCSVSRLSVSLYEDGNKYNNI